jgi:integrase
MVRPRRLRSLMAWLTNSVRLTTVRLAELEPPTTGEQAVLDTEVPGLGVRLRAGGTKTFFVRYRLGGRRHGERRVTIGAVASVPLAEARRAARGILGRVAQGADVQAERREGARREEARLDRAIAAYGEDLRRRQVVRADAITTLLSRELVGRLGGATDVATLSRADFVRVFDAVEQSGRPGTAEDLRTRASVALNWCVAKGIVSANVLAGLKRARRTRAEEGERGGRALTSPEEVAALWHAAEAGGDPYFTAYLRVLLLTGCRRTETAAMRWSWLAEIDGRAFIVVPAAVTKSGRAHAVPLPSAVKAMLSALPRIAEDPDLIFVGRRGRPMSGWTQRWAPVARALHEAGVTGRVTMHDLRRTARSWWTVLGAPTELGELMLNHRPRNALVSLYDRSERLKERYELACKWASKVAEIIAARIRVLPLVRRA